LLIAVASCGKKLPPVAPESVAPEPVKDLRVVSREGRLLVVFNKPTKNMDGSRLTDLAGFKVMRRVADEKGCKGCPEKFPVVYDIDVIYPVGAIIEGDRVIYPDKDIEAGVRYEYKVVAYNKDGYEGPESQRIAFLWAQPPDRPINLKGKGGDKVADLEWDAPETLLDGSKATDLVGCNIYRREEGRRHSIDPVNPAPIRETSFSDFGLKNDKTYYYTVRAVRAVNEGLIEGPSADEIAVIPKEMLIEEIKTE
jgi:hypothetical protein